MLLQESGISGSIAISLIHSTSPHWRKYQTERCEGVTSASPQPWHLGWKFGEEKCSRYLHPPKKHQEKQVWSHDSPKCDPYTNSCGTEEFLPTLQSPQDVLSLGTCQKGTLWSQKSLWTAIIIIIIIIIRYFHLQSPFETSANRSPHLLVKEDNNFSPVDPQGWQRFLGG